MQKRAKTTQFTFPDSGKSFYAPHVSTVAIAMKLRRRYKKPMPPVQEIDYGDGRPVKEMNYSDPDYKRKLTDWESFIEEQAGDIALRKIFDVKLGQEQQAEVDAWKEANPDEFDPQLDSDTQIWFEEIAIASDNDFMAMMEFIKERSEPTEESVQAAVDGF